MVRVNVPDVITVPLLAKPLTGPPALTVVGAVMLGLAAVTVWDPDNPTTDNKLLVSVPAP